MRLFASKAEIKPSTNSGRKSIMYKHDKMILTYNVNATATTIIDIPK